MFREFSAFATTDKEPYMIVSVADTSVIRFMLGKFREEAEQAFHSENYTKAEVYLHAANMIKEALAEIEKGKEEG